MNAELLMFRSLADAGSIAELPEVVMQQPVMPVMDVESHLEAAREEGRRAALMAAQADMERLLQAEREQLQRVVEQFEQEKRRYFNEVEGEVVKLSLAIAERVLHREAEMDPLLLAGAARVALEQVQDTSDAVLRVAHEDVPEWSERLQQSKKSVAIEGDPELERGDVVLKTKSGTVQLGLRAQLEEIERGFFQLLRCRPAVAV